MRSLIAWLTVIVTSSVMAENAKGVVQYTVTDLGTLGGSWSRGFGINSSGQVAGLARVVGDSSYQAFVYSGSGTMQDLGTPSGYKNSEAEGINNRGQIVGIAFTNDDQERAFLYSGDGPAQLLGTLGGVASVAYGINDSGQLVGWSHAADGHQRAFLYSGSGPMQDLGTLGGAESRASRINSSGQVVGDSRTANGQTHAFLYSGSGPMQDLGTLGGTTSWARGINDEGQVVGEAQTAAGQYHAFLYSSNGPMQDLGALGGINSWANGINTSGQIVGSVYTGYYGGTYHYTAFLCSGGKMADLNSLIDPTAGYTVTVAYDINDAGQIVGYGSVGSGEEHAFLLTPTPEPSTLALLSIGALTLLAYAWRKRTAGSARA
jgi:probable HAF family extracellular repeat protein